MIIFQQFDNFFTKIEQLVVPHNKLYCEKYNIKYHSFLDYEKVQSKKRYWNKILLCYKILNSTEEEWLLMLDGDIVLYPDNNIEIIPKIISKNKDFGVCRICDKLENFLWNINIGALFVRNTEFSKNIIKKMIDIGESNNYNIYEQPIFQEMLKQNYKGLLEKTEIFSPNAFNNSGGPFVFHPCGQEDTTTLNIDGVNNKFIKLQKEIKKYHENTLYRSL